MTDTTQGRTVDDQATKQRTDVGVSESQLERWGLPQPSRSATVALGYIREALGKRYWHERVAYDVYLHGSYGRGTNIDSERPADIIVELTSTFLHDISRLSPLQQESFRNLHHSTGYGWGEFKAEVTDGLSKYFGRGAVQVHSKSIRIVSDDIMPVTLLAGVRHRSYTEFRNVAAQAFDEGVTFYDPTHSRWAVIYPKHAEDNTVRKDARTRGWYLSGVRAIKQMRALLIDLGTIPAELAPSWFVEGLLYNVPDELFDTSHRHTVVKILRHLKETDMTGFVRQDEMAPLFGGSPEQWSYRDATRFVDELIRLWWNWS